MQHELIDTNTGKFNPYYFFMGCCLFLAEWFKNLKDFEVPLGIMQLFQIGAWTATIICAFVGTYLSYKKHKNNKYYPPNEN